MTQQQRNTLQYRTYQFALWLLSALGLFCVAVEAATYNFYFNTNEQGDGGTITNTQMPGGTPLATPELTLEEDDGAVEIIDEPSDEAEEEAAPMVPVEQSSPSSFAKAPFRKNDHQMFSFTVGASRMELTNRSFSSNWDSDFGFIDSWDYEYGTYTGGRIGASFRPLSYFGFGVGASLLNDGMYGTTAVFEAEVEVAPVKLTLFGFQDAFEAFAVAGSNFFLSEESFGAYYGVGARFNFGGQWSVEAAARHTFASSYLDDTPTIVTAGLGYKF